MLTEDDLFGTRVRAPLAEGPPRGSLVPDFALLRHGDLLVHVDYGIGRFGGLVRLPAGDAEAEFVLLLYQDDAKLYVPVGALDRLQRYIAAEGARPALDRLGGRGWATTKKRAKKAILGMARELLELAALRRHAPGHAFAPDTPWQAEFEMAFEYPPTRDQLRAAEETKADMERPHPMDRLVCGDVGYGKTEVAMRAAFKAVDGRQAGGAARPDDRARPAALRDLPRALRPLADARRGPQPLRAAEGAAPGRSRRSPPARSTSSSARTASSARTWSSPTSACSSSTRSSASACATRRRSSACARTSTC